MTARSSPGATLKTKIADRDDRRNAGTPRIKNVPENAAAEIGKNERVGKLLRLGEAIVNFDEAELRAALRQRQ